MFLVGLTGGIASGKSTVTKCLRQYGCPIIDADVIAREVVAPGQPAWREIRDFFGSEVFRMDGSLDRQALGEIVFGDESKRLRLNAITHPRIYRKIVSGLLKHLVCGEHFVVLDMPLLLEKKFMIWLLSEIVVVYCDETQQVERLMARNDLDERAALQRIGAQMPLAEKCRLASVVIDNSGSIAETQEQVRNLHQRLSKSNAYWKFRLAAILVVTAVAGGVAAVFQFVIRLRS